MARAGDLDFGARPSAAPVLIVLVTGATGFIGRHVTQSLVSAGHEVHAVARDTGPPSPGVTWHAVDLLSEPIPSAALMGTQVLVHLAWDAGPGYLASQQNPSWVNASLALAEAFADAGGSRVVAAGTCAEYDWRLPALDGGLSETAPTHPSSPYAEAKLAFRDGLLALKQLSVAWGRIFWLVGPGERPGRLVPSVSIAAVRGDRITIRDSDDVRDFVDVRQLAHGFRLLVDSSLTGVVNLGSGRGRAVGEVARLAAAAAGRPECVELLMSETGPHRVVADMTKARAQLGFGPADNLESAVAASVAEWKGKA